MIDTALRYIDYIEKTLDRNQEILNLLKSSLEDFKNYPSFENQIRLSGIISHIEKFELSKYKNNELKYYLSNSENFTIRIDKDWKAFEFDRIFKTIDFLNKLYVIQYKLKKHDSRLVNEETRSFIYKNAKLYHYIAPFEEIRVSKIEYASPGFITFNGIGEVVSKIQNLVSSIIAFEFIRKIVDNYDYFKYKRPLQIEREKADLRNAIRKTETESIEEENRKLELQSNYDQLKYKIEKDRLNRKIEVIKELIEICDLIEILDSKKIANKEILESQIIQCLSSLNNLGFENEKIKTLE